MKTFQEKEEILRSAFSKSCDKQKIYLQIIEFGKKLPALEKRYQTPENRVPGCQSASYLRTIYQEGKLRFEGTSDALISKGLLALMITLYNDEPPETLLTQEPTCLKELNILTSISMTRLNGIMGLYTKMRKEAIKHIQK